MKPVAELIAVPGKSFPALVFADGFRDLPAGTKLYVGPEFESGLLERIRAYISEYHFDLDTRQNGNLAMDRAFSGICRELAMFWHQGEEAKKRAKAREGASND